MDMALDLWIWNPASSSVLPFFLLGHLMIPCVSSFSHNLS